MIYETDPYIYPAMFEGNIPSYEAGVEVLPHVIETEKDEMFRKENLFLYIEDEAVIGVIMWYKGCLNWNPDVLLKVAQDRSAIASLPQLNPEHY